MPKIDHRVSQILLVGRLSAAARVGPHHVGSIGAGREPEAAAKVRKVAFTAEADAGIEGAI
jgi:hypothetical protein